MKIFRSLGLQWHEWAIIALILGIAASFALTVNSYSKRFEEALEVEADAKQHQITELVSTLAALERTIRTGEGRAGGVRLTNITSSLEESSELIQARLQNHSFSANGAYSRALLQLDPLIKNLQSWLTRGFAGLSATDPIVIKIVNQEIYLAKLQLQRERTDSQFCTGGRNTDPDHVPYIHLGLAATHKKPHCPGEALAPAQTDIRLDQ